jgi:NmrA-like family
MTSNRTILITGVTGNEGGAVAQALQGAGFHLRGLTRKPDSEPVAAHGRQGVEIVKGNLDDEVTLRRALAGAWGVFGVQNAGEAGAEREETQGKRLATLAREAGVEHYVYTSVGSAHQRTGIPHFDNKWRIEETVRGLRFPSHVILRPVFFMEESVANLECKPRTGKLADDQATIATPKRSVTNRACPTMSSFGNHRICPLRIMFIVSIPWIVRHAAWNDRKPWPALTLCLIAR